MRAVHLLIRVVALVFVYVGDGHSLCAFEAGAFAPLDDRPQAPAAIISGNVRLITADGEPAVSVDVWAADSVTGARKLPRSIDSLE